MKGDILNNQLFKKVLLPLALLVFTLSSCDLSVAEDKDFLIAGTWGDNYGQIVVTENRYESYYVDYMSGELKFSHAAEIVSFDNGTFNTETANTDLGDHGYLVLKSLDDSDPAQYGVLRWKSLETVDGVTTLSYSEGYKASNPTAPMAEWVGIYFNSASEAKNGMDDTFFSYYSKVTKK